MILQDYSFLYAYWTGNITMNTDSNLHTDLKWLYNKLGLLYGLVTLQWTQIVNVHTEQTLHNNKHRLLINILKWWNYNELPNLHTEQSWHYNEYSFFICIQNWFDITINTDY